MTREEAILILQELWRYERVKYKDYEVRTALDMAIKALEQEPKIEKEIRDELKRLTTYRMSKSNTDLVTLRAVERVLNLVFRGYRDRE